MTKEELQNRISKKEAQIEKLNKKIKKWQDKQTKEDLWKEDSWLFDPQRETKEEFLDRRIEDHIKYCKSEVRSAERELEEAQLTLKKYKDQLKAKEEFDKEVKVQVLVDFLNNWGTKVYDWYIRNAERYIELRKGHKEAHQQFKEQYEKQYCRPYKYNYWLEMDFERDYYSGINEFTKSIVLSDRIDTEALGKMIEQEKVRKYKDLVSRISKVVGDIEDVNYLSIGNQNGEINGYVKGTLGKAEVETISAGGYNIQVFHYRVLVKKIK